MLWTKHVFPGCNLSSQHCSEDEKQLLLLTASQNDAIHAFYHSPPELCSAMLQVDNHCQLLTHRCDSVTIVGSKSNLQSAVIQTFLPSKDVCIILFLCVY